jgi:flagellar motor component MotA
MKIKFNAYPVVDNLEQGLAEALKLAKKKRAKLLEIAYGTASQSAKRRILNFLMKKENRRIYNRLEKSIQGWGRIYVHFRWKDKASHK